MSISQLFFLMVLFFEVQCHNRSLVELPGVEKTVHTFLGEVKMRIIGEELAGNIPVIALPGSNPKLVTEWIPVASKLAANGFVVTILDFYSNKNARHQAMTLIHDAIKRNTLTDDKVVIMGKSYGGSIAQSFAVRYPKEVLKLCLVAPATSDEGMIDAIHDANVPVFLAWAKDDTTASFSNAKKWSDSFRSDLQLYTANNGGHRILMEYEDPILAFLQS